MTINRHDVNRFPPYPLRFKPIYQYRLWGGRRLTNVLSAPLPENIPIGEAWLLSDRDDHPSIVANGPLKGLTIKQLIDLWPKPLLGKSADLFCRFPLLLKFLDARDTLSVQVHPSDGQTKYIPEGETGKTEAWVVLEAGPQSRIYAGLKPGTNEIDLRKALTDGTVAERLACFCPKPDDAVLIEAGTIHSLGDVVVFEVQENSDVTFRLYDWTRVDAKTGKPRPLHIEQAMACTNFEQGAASPVVPVVEEVEPVLREKLFFCEHFGLWRHRGDFPFIVGAAGSARVLVCIAGNGSLEFNRAEYLFGKGDVLLLPAILGACLCRTGDPVTLLEISLPEKITA